MNIRSSINISKYLNKSPKAAEFTKNAASMLSNPSHLLPVILLEGTVIAGRTHQADKRGGWVEARERFTEEVLTSIVWLGGFKAFNGVFDSVFKALGKKDIFKDFGKDAIRNPSKDVRLTTAFSKFGKIAASVVAGIYLIGNLIPRLNQKITQEYFDKNKQNKLKSNNRLPLQKSRISMQDYLDNCKKKTVSFKGSIDSSIKYVCHNLETHPLWGVLSQDVGMTSGRSINARNKDERIEILFRDITSVFFYMFSIPFIMKKMQKFFDKDKITKIDSKLAHNVNQKIGSQYIGDNKAAKDIKTLKTELLGSKTDTDKKLIKNVQDWLFDYKNKAISIDLDPNGKPFEGAKLEAYVNDCIKKYKGKNPKVKDGNQLIKLLSSMPDKEITSKQIIEAYEQAQKVASDLQPFNKYVIAHSQIADIIEPTKNGMINDSKVLKDLLGKATHGKTNDPNAFISQKHLDNIRQNIDNYVGSIFKKAENVNKTNITKDFIKDTYHKSLVKKLGFFGVGFAFSSLVLSTIIPKIQYYITRRRTGEDKFPGVKGLQDMK